MTTIEHTTSHAGRLINHLDFLTIKNDDGILATAVKLPVGTAAYAFLFGFSLIEAVSHAACTVLVKPFHFWIPKEWSSWIDRNVFYPVIQRTQDSFAAAAKAIANLFSYVRHLHFYGYKQSPISKPKQVIEKTAEPMSWFSKYHKHVAMGLIGAVAFIALQPLISPSFWIDKSITLYNAIESTAYTSVMFLYKKTFFVGAKALSSLPRLTFWCIKAPFIHYKKVILIATGYLGYKAYTKVSNL